MTDDLGATMPLDRRELQLPLSYDECRARFRRAADTAVPSSSRTRSTRPGSMVNTSRSTEGDEQVIRVGRDLLGAGVAPIVAWVR